jgi:DNA repair photolyase
MGLNESKGNMYDWVTHTWNAVKGACPHNCRYCYMKRWGKQKPVRLDEKEFRTNLGSGNTIFVGSSCDMWAKIIPGRWIHRILNYCKEYDNRYLFQTKNPQRLIDLHLFLPKNTILCTTIETNDHYPEFMGKTPRPVHRAIAMAALKNIGYSIYVTIEPIMDFHLEQMVDIIELCKPDQVNIGADSGNNGLPEPSRKKVEKLIKEL